MSETLKDSSGAFEYKGDGWYSLGEMSERPPESPEEPLEPKNPEVFEESAPLEEKETSATQEDITESSTDEKVADTLEGASASGEESVPSPEDESLSKPEEGMPAPAEEAALVSGGSLSAEGGETASDSGEGFRPVGEMSTEEVGKEYIDLLVELSEDFTSAEAKTSAAAGYNEDGTVHIYNPSGYSGKEKRVVQRIEGEDGEHMGREWTIAMADDIIHAESDWRAAGEETTVEDEQETQAEFDADYSKKQAKLDRFRRGFGGRMRQRLFPRKEAGLIADTLNARDAKSEAGKKTEKANERLKKALEAAYSEEYGYGHHTIDDEKKADEVNDEYNERFFGDEERRRKIDRAIELRRRLTNDDVLSQEWD